MSQRNNAATKKFLIFYVTLLPNVNNLNSKPKGTPAFYIANVTKKNILSLSSKKQNRTSKQKKTNSLRSDICFCSGLLNLLDCVQRKVF